MSGVAAFRAQSRTLLILLRVSASISFLCSTLLVVNILGDYQTKLKHIYQRLLLALSVCDMISSLNLSQAGWISDYNATCQVSGLLQHFGVSVGLYNVMLCLHFMLIICYEWTPTKFQQHRWAEYAMHLVAIGWPLSFGIAGLALGTYGEIGFMPKTCTYDQYPDGRCDTCREVPHAAYLQLAGMVVPAVLSFLMILYTLVRIFWHVFQQEQKQLKYQFGATTTMATTDTTKDTTHGTRFHYLSSLRQSTASITTTGTENTPSGQARPTGRLSLPSFRQSAPSAVVTATNHVDVELTQPRRQRRLAISMPSAAAAPISEPRSNAANNSQSNDEAPSASQSNNGAPRQQPRRFSLPSFQQHSAMTRSNNSDHDTTMTQTRPLRRLSLQSLRQSLTTHTTATTESTQQQQQKQQKAQKRKFRKCKESAKQAGLFILAHLLTNTPTLVAFAILNFHPDPYGGSIQLFQLAGVVCFFWPLQGLWNLIIYARPRYKNLRHKHPETNFVVLLGMALWQRSTPNKNKHKHKHKYQYSHTPPPRKLPKWRRQQKKKKKKTNQPNNVMLEKADQEGLDDFSRIMSQPLEHVNVNKGVNGDEEKEEETSVRSNTEHVLVESSGMMQLFPIDNAENDDDREDDTSVAPFDENFEMDEEEKTDHEQSAQDDDL